MITLPTTSDFSCELSRFKPCLGPGYFLLRSKSVSWRPVICWLRLESNSIDDCNKSRYGESWGCKNYRDPCRYLKAGVWARLCLPLALAKDVISSASLCENFFDCLKSPLSLKLNFSDFSSISVDSTEAFFDSDEGANSSGDNSFVFSTQGTSPTWFWFTFSTIFGLTDSLTNLTSSEVLSILSRNPRLSFKHFPAKSDFCSDDSGSGKLHPLPAADAVGSGSSMKTGTASYIPLFRRGWGDSDRSRASAGPKTFSRTVKNCSEAFRKVWTWNEKIDAFNQWHFPEWNRANVTIIWKLLLIVIYSLQKLFYQKNFLSFCFLAVNGAQQGPIL